MIPMDGTEGRSMYDSLREYNDGTLDKVIARKLAEIVALKQEIGDRVPSRNQALLLKTLTEDTMLYDMVRRLVSATELEFPCMLEEVLPVFDVELEEVPRSVIDNYRRKLSDAELMLEDKALGYVDDVKGIATGRCRY